MAQGKHRRVGTPTEQSVGEEWVSFPGGELEGKRPKILCPTCRDALKASAARPRSVAAAKRPLCFQCYRAGLERDRQLRAAGQLDTASAERFQSQLPFEAVDVPRLAMLKAERANQRALGTAGTTTLDGTARFADRRRRAQIAARHMLHALGAGLKAREFAAHVAELQLPESWLPFVVSR
jgi:hypothetical protein